MRLDFIYLYTLTWLKPGQRRSKKEKRRPKNEHSHTYWRYLVFLSKFSALQLLLGIFVYVRYCIYNIYIFRQIEGDVECERVCECACVWVRGYIYNNHYMHTLSKCVLLSFAQQTLRFSPPRNERIYENVRTHAHKHIHAFNIFCCADWLKPYWNCLHASLRAPLCQQPTNQTIT